MQFSERLRRAEAEGELPDLNARLLVEQVQHNLFRLVPHVEWSDPQSGDTKTYEHTYFLHEERATE
jgi:hypothetical protein